MEAGLAVIMERGYHAATLTEIARRAGVGTPAIYRRWPTKADLAIDVLIHVSEPEPIPNTGSIRDDLVAFMRQRLGQYATPLFRQLLLPLMLQGFAQGSLANQVRDRFVDYRIALVERIRRSIAVGELRADADPTRLLNLLMGTVTVPLIFFHDIPPIGEAESIVDQVLSGFALHPHGSDSAD
jgi:AcrR family transcriptional regulator